jgi:hypothetical protein
VASAFLNEKLNFRGINIGRQLRGRKRDNIGIGYGYLKGGNTVVDKTQVAEAYVRFGLNKYVALTLDAQYMDDKYVPDEGTNLDGWIVGARMTVEFSKERIFAQETQTGSERDGLKNDLFRL